MIIWVGVKIASTRRSQEWVGMAGMTSSSFSKTQTGVLDDACSRARSHTTTTAEPIALPLAARCGAIDHLGLGKCSAGTGSLVGSKIENRLARGRRDPRRAPRPACPDQSAGCGSGQHRQQDAMSCAANHAISRSVAGSDPMDR